VKSQMRWRPLTLSRRPEPRIARTTTIPTPPRRSTGHPRSFLPHHPISEVGAKSRSSLGRPNLACTPHPRDPAGAGSCAAPDRDRPRCSPRCGPPPPMASGTGSSGASSCDQPGRPSRRSRRPAASRAPSGGKPLRRATSVTIAPSSTPDPAKTSRTVHDNTAHGDRGETPTRALTSANDVKRYEPTSGGTTTFIFANRARRLPGSTGAAAGTPVCQRSRENPADVRDLGVTKRDGRAWESPPDLRLLDFPRSRTTPGSN